MSQKGIIAGDINGLHTEANILWKIPNYFSIQRADFFYDSPSFHFWGSTWKLRIYPNGERLCKSVEYVGLHVIQETQHEKRSISFKIRIMGDDNLLKERSGFFYDNGVNSAGWDKYVSRNTLLRLRYQIAPENTLTVKFVGLPLNHKAVAGSQTTIMDGINALSRDFQTLLGSEQASDVAIKVNSRIFRAHKLILGARSVVFSAMFQHDMKEKNTSTVNIVDSDPSSFQEFLLFIYTGKVDNLSLENVIDIFMLANKYDIRDLKQICIDFMEENLNLNMVCSVLSVADKFNVLSLKQSARKLLSENIKTVMSTENWIHFIRENPKLATEILMTAMAEGSSSWSPWRYR